MNEEERITTKCKWKLKKGNNLIQHFKLKKNYLAV
jgi:hypothetical protein